MCNQSPLKYIGTYANNIKTTKRSPHCVIADGADARSQEHHRVDLAYDETRARGSDTAFPFGCGVESWDCMLLPFSYPSHVLNNQKCARPTQLLDPSAQAVRAHPAVGPGGPADGIQPDARVGEEAGREGAAGRVGV